MPRFYNSHVRGISLRQNSNLLERIAALCRPVQIHCDDIRIAPRIAIDAFRDNTGICCR